MNIRFLPSDQLTTWDKLVLSNPDDGNALQSLEMASQKTRQGWTPKFITADALAILALEYSVFGLGKLWYIPKGPGVNTTEDLASLLPNLKDFARQNGAFMIKIEPEIIKTDQALRSLGQLGLLKVRNVQPNASTVLINLSGNIEEIMASLNQKGRHAIRRAERDGVTIKPVPSTKENCKAMFDLYKITAESQFGIRPYKYYQSFWQNFEKAGIGQMFFAYYNDDVIASAYALSFGKKSVYKDGASLRSRPVYGASHLLQWEIIKWAKQSGSILHDLSGAPPSDKINDPSHPYHGIGRFKTSFNKQVTDYIGTYDVVIHPLRYKLWLNFGEKLALRFSFWLNHESFY